MSEILDPRQLAELEILGILLESPYRIKDTGAEELGRYIIKSEGCLGKKMSGFCLKG